MFEVRDLTKVYRRGGGTVNALAGIDLSVPSGEIVAVAGASGAGKSTLLHVLGALENPTSGTVEWQGQDLGSMSDRQLTALRRSCFGFIFQNFNLVPTLTALENVEAAMTGMGRAQRANRVRALALLDEVGLAERTTHLPDQLSGGEQQRVAIARALANEPSVIFADEPTGNLDHENGLRIIGMLRRLHERRGLTVVVVTHDMEIASCAQRVVRMRDGRLLDDTREMLPGAAPVALPAAQAV